MGAKNHPLHLDANESAFFRRQLEHIKAQTYDTKFKDLKYSMFLPVSTEAPAGADTITFRRFTDIGFAKIVADYAHDFPRVDTYGEEETVKVKSLGASYGYNIKEIRRAAMAGLQLNQRRARSARRAIEELLNTLAWSGDTVHNIQGFLSYPGITEYTIPNDGTSTTKTWSTKTPDQIIRDLNGMITAVVNTTNGREVPNQILIPLEQYRLIASTRVTDGDTNTILRFFLSTNPGVAVDWLVELNNAGAGSTDRIMCYVRDPNNVTFEIPQPFEVFDPDKEGMEYVVPVHAECGGVIVYYPLSVSFGDGI